MRIWEWVRAGKCLTAKATSCSSAGRYSISPTTSPLARCRGAAAAGECILDRQIQLPISQTSRPSNALRGLCRWACAIPSNNLRFDTAGGTGDCAPGVFFCTQDWGSQRSCENLTQDGGESWLAETKVRCRPRRIERKIRPPASVAQSGVQLILTASLG